MRFFCQLVFIAFPFLVFSQTGTVTGTVMDEKGKGLENATLKIISFTDSVIQIISTSDKNGLFTIHDIPFGYHKLRISYISFQPISRQ